MTLRYPAARRGDDVDVLHGERVADPYRWLENADSDETQTWCDAQDELVNEHRPRWERRDAFRERIGALMAVGGVASPRAHGDRLFVARRAAGAEHWSYLVLEGDGSMKSTTVFPLGSSTIGSSRSRSEPSASTHR